MRARGARRSLSALVVGGAALLALVGGSVDARAGKPAKKASPAAAPSPAPAVAPAVVPLTRASIEIPLASLPQGQLLDQDWAHVPAALPAGGHIAGVKLHRESTHYAAPGQSMIEIAEADDDDARTDDRAPRLESLCFDTASYDNHDGSRRRTTRRHGGSVTTKIDGDDEPPERWRGGMSSRTQVVRQRDNLGRAPIKDRVQQLHIEQIVTSAQGPALESRDFWVDAETGGARVRATARLPLRDLGERTIGLHLFAGRVGDEVVFVAAQSPSSRNLFSTRKDEGAQVTNCGHLSVRLDIKRGMSEVAGFESILTLPDPSKEAEAEAKAKAKGEDASLTVDDGENFRNGKARVTTPGSGIGLGPPATRTRIGRVFFDTSWEPNEAAPLLSFSESWGNRAHDE